MSSIFFSGKAIRYNQAQRIIPIRNIYLQIDPGSTFGSIHLMIPDTPITRPIPPDNKSADIPIRIHPVNALRNIFLKWRCTINRDKGFEDWLHLIIRYMIGNIESFFFRTNYVFILHFAEKLRELWLRYGTFFFEISNSFCSFWEFTENQKSFGMWE